MKTNFTYSYAYSSAFVEISKFNLKTKFYPCDLIESWEFFIENVEDGYGDIGPEYDYDRWVRNNIEPFLYEVSLDNFPDHNEFKKVIQELDTRFLTATQPNPSLSELNSGWWNKRLPLKAGKEFIDFIGEDTLKKNRNYN